MFFRWALFLSLIGFVLYHARLQHMEQYLNTHVVKMILLVQPFILLTALLVALRIKLLVNPPGVSFILALKAILLGVGLNVILPGRLSELLKPVYLHGQGGVPFSVGLAAVVVERVTDFIAMGLLAILAWGQVTSDGSMVWVFPLGAVLMALPLVSRYEPGLLRLAQQWPGERIRGLVLVFLSALANRLREGVMLRAMAYAILAWATTFAALFWLILLAGSIEIHASQAAYLILIASVGGAAAVLPGGFGSYEAGAVFALQSFGYEFEEALVLAVAMHITQLAPNVIGALLIVLREKLGIALLAQEAVQLVKPSTKPPVKPPPSEL